MSETKTGNCLCGAVKLTAVLENNLVDACHCSICRRQAAGPYMTMHCKSLDVEGGEALGLYRASDYGERGFCSKCGSVLFWRTQDGSMTVVSANALDDLGEVILKTEIFVDEQPGYYSFAQKTDRLTGAQVAEMFADVVS